MAPDQETCPALHSRYTRFDDKEDGGGSEGEEDQEVIGRRTFDLKLRFCHTSLTP